MKKLRGRPGQKLGASNGSTANTTTTTPLAPGCLWMGCICTIIIVDMQTSHPHPRQMMMSHCRRERLGQELRLAPFRGPLTAAAAAAVAVAVAV